MIGLNDLIFRPLEMMLRVIMPKAQQQQTKSKSCSLYNQYKEKKTVPQLERTLKNLWCIIIIKALYIVTTKPFKNQI